MQIIRTISAFLIAPFSVPVVATLLLQFAESSVPLPGFLIISSIIAYIITYILGIPTFLMLEAWGLKSLGSYLAGSLILAMLPTLLFYFLLEDMLLAVSILLASILECVLFWTINTYNRIKNF